MNDHLSLSRAGEATIKAFENCLKRLGDGRYKPYVCPAGVLTIGWGHTNHHGRPFNAGSIWTRAECDAAFIEDMRGFEAAVRRVVTVELNQHQFDALVSFAYNCGEGNLASSTLLKKVNRRDFEGAAREFARWNKGGGRVLAGLVRRRASEALLFQGIADKDFDGKPDAQAIEPRVSESPASPDDTIEQLDNAMPQGVDPPAPAKTMAQSTIGNSQIVAGGTTLVTTGAAVVKATVDDPGTVASSPASHIDISDLIARGGDAVDTAGTVARHAPEAVSFGKIALGFITEPLVLAALGAVALGFIGYTWWERRRKLREDGV